MNKQITEDYASEEVAKLLQMKGFDKPCDSYYEWFESGVTLYKGYMPEFYHGRYKPVSDMLHLKRPTHQMALKWLREVHDLHIIVYPWQADKEEKAIHWCCTVYKSFAHLGNDVYTNETPKSYEQAVEAALLYVLKNLI